MKNILLWIVGLFFLVIVPLNLIIYSIKEYMIDTPKYMKRQKETKEDKIRLLHFMHQIMQDEYTNFLYVVAYYITTEQCSGRIVHDSLPYIIAFNESKLIIFSYLVREGKFFCIKKIPVVLSQNKVTCKHTKRGVFLTFLSGHEKLPMYVDRIVKSSGYEYSCNPLGIYQESEVNQLVSLLQQYTS